MVERSKTPERYANQLTSRWPPSLCDKHAQEQCAVSNPTEHSLHLCWTPLKPARDVSLAYSQAFNGEILNILLPRRTSGEVSRGVVKWKSVSQIVIVYNTSFRFNVELQTNPASTETSWSCVLHLHSHVSLLRRLYLRPYKSHSAQIASWVIHLTLLKLNELPVVSTEKCTIKCSAEIKTKKPQQNIPYM